jgi:PAS domain S-box-containing protein
MLVRELRSRPWSPRCMTPEPANFPHQDIYRLLVEQTKDYAVFALDFKGYVRTWNVGAERLKGYRPQDIIGKHFSTFYAQEDVARDWPARELAMASAEGRFEDEGWRVRKDGSRFWANVVITALRDEDGKLVAFSKITRDLTGRRMHEEALRQSEERFRLLVESVTEYAVNMLDLDGAVTSWNGGAQRITGYSREDALGSHFSRFYPEEDRAGLPWEHLALARRTGRVETEGWRVRKNGERFWARVVITALHERDQRLRGFAQITQDLSDRRHIQSLEQAARNVGDFIAVLAHELRNPLAPIRNAAQLMNRLPADHPSQASMREMIERQSAQLTRIVDDILDMARITKGVIAIERVAVDLDRLLDTAVETAQPQVDERKHRLSVQRRAPGTSINGDAHRLTQVLVNLLSNAVRYTPPGGEIAVAVDREENSVTIRVRDNGRGIEPELKERIFDMFVRGRDANADKNNSGLGVGLALARKIVELHGGAIDVVSEGAGKGSEFIVRLPVAQAREDPKPAPVPLKATTPRHVLLVDDNRDAAAALELVLKEMGHRTLVVHGGAEALEKISGNDLDYVFLDLGMPGIDGYEVARRVRANKQLRQPRLIALTGWGQEDDRRQTRDAGFDAHLVKPVSSDDIARAMGH